MKTDRKNLADKNRMSTAVCKPDVTMRAPAQPQFRRAVTRLGTAMLAVILLLVGGTTTEAQPSITINGSASPSTLYENGGIFGGGPVLTSYVFNSVSIDADGANVETEVELSITMVPANAGVFSDSDWTLVSEGTYEYTAGTGSLSASAAQTELNSLQFTANDNLAPDSTTIPIVLTVTVENSAGSALDSVGLSLEGQNSDPTISILSFSSVVEDTDTTQPFWNVSISDSDNDELTVRISIVSDSSNFGEVVGGEFTYTPGPFDPSATVEDLTGGVYRIRNQTENDMETILERLVFNPTDDQLKVISAGSRPLEFGVQFVVEIADGAGFYLGTPQDQDEVSLDVYPFNDAPVITGADVLGSPTDDPEDANRFVIPDRILDVDHADVTDNLIVTIGPHDLAIGTEVRLVLPEDVFSFPADLPDQPYYVIDDGDADETTLKLSTTLGGSEVDILNDPGSGALQLSDVTLLELFHGIAISDVDTLGQQPVRSSGSVVRVMEGAIGEAGTDFSEAPLGMFHFPDSFGMDSAPDFFFEGSQANVAQQMQSVRFIPTPNLLPVGEENRLEITIVASDFVPPPVLGSSLEKLAVGNRPSDDPAVYWILSLNDPPTITARVNPTSVLDTQRSINPFSVEISDPDPLDDAFRVTLGVSQGSAFASLSPTPLEFPPFSSPQNYLSESDVQFSVAGALFSPIRNSTDTTEDVEIEFTVTDRHGLDGEPASALIKVVGKNDPPNILGWSNSLLFIRDDRTLTPLENIRVDDVDSSLVNVTVSIDSPSLATLDPTGPFDDISPADVTDLLKELQFTPVDGEVSTGESEQVILTVTVTDVNDSSLSETKTGTIVILGVNSAPVITFTPGGDPRVISPDDPKPFNTISITDDEPGSVTVEVAMENPSLGTLTNLGSFSEMAPGVYSFTGDPADAATYLNSMLFIPSDTYPFPANSPIQAGFQIRATDAQLKQSRLSFDISLQEELRNLLVWKTDDNEESEALVAGTLRYAVSKAGSGDHITFALSQYPETIRLKRPIVLGRNVTLKGPGADNLILSGDTKGDGVPETQIFKVEASVVIEGLTLTHGTATSGGAVSVNENGNLTLRGCAVTESRASAWGGGIDVHGGGLVIENSLIRGNQVDPDAGQGGGGISVYSSLPVRIDNTTFSGNMQSGAAGVGGGALYLENATPETPFVVRISHSTFAENTDAADEGSSILANVFGTEARLFNSIFADRQGRNLQIKGVGDIVSEGGNISDDTALSFIVQGGVPKAVKLLDHATDRTELDPLLLTLGLGGAHTAHYPLDALSPARDTAHSSVEFPAAAVDQLNRMRDSSPDVGATEYSSFALVDIGKAPRQILVNEIQFNGDPADFVELYVPRDSGPTDISGFTLYVDGVSRHSFAADTVLSSGAGIIVAESAITTPTPVSSTGAAAAGVMVATLGLEPRGVVELRRPDADVPEGKVVARVDYVGVFVNPNLDPNDAAQPADIGDSSITLVPQFRGFAFLPHELDGCGALPGAVDDVLAVFGSFGSSPSSPGADACGNAFGGDNSAPIAGPDVIVANEDLRLALDVLSNDFDADGSDRIFITGVGTTKSGPHTADGVSELLADLDVDPLANPLRGEMVFYDPRVELNHLSEGIEARDTFVYLIADIGTGFISGFEDSGADVIVVSPGHRLSDGTGIRVIGGDYDGVHTVGEFLDGGMIDPDRFQLQGASFVPDAETGTWETVNPRSEFDSALDNDPHLGEVRVTVIGANDVPMPEPDLAATTEDGILRLMADPDLAGSTTVVFDTDDDFPEPRSIWIGSLLRGDPTLDDDDIDPDDDDSATTLHVVGVVGSVRDDIEGYERASGGTGVIVHAPDHGLSDGAEILIAGYPGHPSYNGHHQISKRDDDSFIIPVAFVDNVGAPGDLWTVFTNDRRLVATSRLGAGVTLEIRDDRRETNVIYNPRVSSYLNGLADGQPEADSFHYVVQDRHGALGVAKVSIEVSGVNDAPQPSADPGSLALLDGSNDPLEKVISDLQVDFFIPPTSGLEGRNDVRVLLGGETPQGVLLADLYSTDQDTPIEIDSDGLTANDYDPDRDDLSGLQVVAVAPVSREGASVNLSGTIVRYDPTEPAALDIFDVQSVNATDELIQLDRDHGLSAGDPVIVTAKLGQSLPASLVDANRYYVLEAGLDFSTLKISPAPGGAPVDFARDIQDGLLEIRSGNVLRMLARGEAIVDTFETTVSDGQGGLTTTLVAVLVTGKNQSPIARNDTDSTLEDAPLSLARLPEELALIPDAAQTPQDRFGVLSNDTDQDINGGDPDDKLALVSIRNYESANMAPDLVSSSWAISPETGATIVMENGRLTYDPITTSPEDPLYLKSLAEGDVHPEMFVYTVMDGSFIFAMDDVFKVAADNSNLFLPILVNDRNLTGNGQSLEIVEVGPPSSGGTVVIAKDADGVSLGIVYTPEIDFVGNEYFTYLLSDSDGNTDRATVSIQVTVNQLNGNLQANDDHFSVARGESAEINVLANDNIIPKSGAGLVLTRVFPDVGDMDDFVEIPEEGVIAISLPSGDSLEVAPDGITFMQESGSFMPDLGTGADSASFAYEISGGGVARASAEVLIGIFDRQGTLRIRDDAFSILAGSQDAPLDVLANDNILPGSTGNLRVTSVTDPSHGAVDLNESGNGLVYTPNPGFVGRDEFSYWASDDLGGTGGGDVVISVGSLVANMDFLAAPYDSVDDGDDASTAADPVEVRFDVLANDRILQDSGPDLELVGVRLASSGAFADTKTITDFGRIGLDSTHRFILFNSEFEAEGEKTFEYSFKDGSGGTAIGMFTVVIVRTGVAANADFFSVNVGSQSNELNVLLNDAAFPASSQDLVITGTGVGLDAPNRGGTVAINQAGDHLVYTPASGFSGEETFTYTMTDSRMTDSTKVVVRVESGVLSANADEFTVFYDPLPMDKVLSFDEFGSLVEQIGRSGSSAGEFDQPTGLALASSLIAVADSGNDRVQILDTIGGTWRSVGFPGSGTGEMNGPSGVAITDGGVLFVADAGNDRIQKFDNSGVFVAQIGSPGITPGRLNRPNDVALFADGRVVVADTGNDRIQVFDGAGSLAAIFGNSGSRDGQFNQPKGVAVDSDGNIWVADTGNHRIQKFSATGIHLETMGGFGAGLGSFNLPEDVAVDGSGRLFIADGGNHRVQIRDASGLFTSIESFDTGDAAEGFNQPSSIAADSTGGFIVANQHRQALREFTLPVLANDRVLPDFGQPITISGVGIDDSYEMNAPDRLGSVEIGTGGAALVYTPRNEVGSFPYVEHFTYEISDGTERRASSTVTVHVERRINLRDMETNDDAFTVRNDSQNNVLAVLANDDIKPSNALGWSITELSEIVPAAEDIENDKDLLIIQGSVLLYTPEPGFVGTKTFVYSVSDGVGGTGSAQVTITVGDIAVSRDEFVTLSGDGANPGDALLLDVLANDNILPAMAQGNPNSKDDFILPENQTIVPDHGGAADVVIDETGRRFVSYSPAGPLSGQSYPYRESFTYLVESDSGELVEGQAVVNVHEIGSDRSAALLTIDVIGVNDEPIIQGLPNGTDGISVYHQLGVHPFAGITITDFDAAGDLCIRVVVDTLDYGDLIPSSDPECADQNSAPLVYEVCGLTPEEAQHCLRELLFVPLGGSRPGAPDITTLTLSVTDQSGSGLLDHEVDVSAYHPEVSRLEASDGDRNDEFGFAVGASRDSVVAGAPFDDDSVNGEISFNKTGSTYVYERNLPTVDAWGGQSKVLAGAPSNGDLYGYSVAISGDGNTMVVGAPNDEHNGFNTGTAYILERAIDGSGEWMDTFKLVPPFGGSSDKFGYSSAISRDGNTVVIGSIHARNGNANTGSVYVFQRNPAAQSDDDLWLLTEKLSPSDGGNDDEYGRAVAISGEYVLVGSPRHSRRNRRIGAVYLYRYDAGDWTNLIGKFQPSAGDNGDEFGHSVDIDGDRFAVGAHLDEANGQKSGTAYVYGLGAGIAQSPVPTESWGLITLLQSSTAADFDQFGYSIAIDGNLLLVGARSDEVNGRRSGSVSVYHQEGEPASEIWRKLEELTPDAVNADDEFGYSLDLERGTAVVGARREEADTGKRYGSVYLYRFKFNNAPTISTLPPGDVVLEVGEDRTIEVSASDPDQDDSVVSIEMSPDSLPWLEFDTLASQIEINYDDQLQNIDVGTYAVTLTATDQDGESGSKVLIVSVIAPRFVLQDAGSNAQLAWVESNMGAGLPLNAQSNYWGAWGDADLDGLSNLHEYAFGSDPMSADDSSSDLMILVEDGEVKLVHLRRTNDPGLDYRVESSSDLHHWSAADTLLELESKHQVDGEFEQIWLKLRPDVRTEGLFFKIRVE